MEEWGKSWLCRVCRVFQVCLDRKPASRPAGGLRDKLTKATGTVLAGQVVWLALLYTTVTMIWLPCWSLQVNLYSHFLYFLLFIFYVLVGTQHTKLTPSKLLKKTVLFVTLFCNTPSFSQMSLKWIFSHWFQNLQKPKFVLRQGTAIVEFVWNMKFQ